jgi:hypothetical protein
MKNIMIILLGLINTLHGVLHIIQFLQSVLLASGHNEQIEKVMENPIFSIIMASIGIITLIIGIKDYLHHKKCKH